MNAMNLTGCRKRAGKHILYGLIADSELAAHLAGAAHQRSPRY